MHNGLHCFCGGQALPFKHDSLKQKKHPPLPIALLENKVVVQGWFGVGFDGVRWAWAEV